MAISWTIAILIAILLGIASHLLVFIHGELDRYAAVILAVFSVAFAAAVAWATIREGSLISGVILATVLFASYQSSLASSIVVYRLMFHRTRHFDGPVLAAISKWYAARQAKATEQYHHVLANLHLKYGDFVRIGPMEISICTADAVHALYGLNSECLKGPFYDLGGVGQNLHRTRDPVLHHLQRPFWEKGFTPEALEQNTKGIHILARKFVTTISQYQTQSVNLTPLVNQVGFEMMSQSTFSRQFDLNSGDQTKVALQSLHESQALLGTYGHVPWIYAIAKYCTGLLPSNDRFTKLADRMVAHRRNQKPESPDLFSFLFQTENNPEAAGFPLAWEARLAIVAGSANTSNTIISCCFYLATHPKVQSSLHDEVSPLVSKGEFDMRKPLTILDSIVRESMRLQPAMPSGVERMTPPRGLDIGGTFIPGNTICRVPNYVTFRDQRYFVQPNDFMPERWATRKDLVLDGSIFRPFGQGRYSCVGSSLAMMKIRTVLAYLVTDFEFLLADKTGAERWERSGREYFLMAHRALNLRFEKRA